MIKQIQLRGISRTPSDRLSEDGGLSESLNMYMDTAESAPAFVPEDVTAGIGLPADISADRIFVHKTANYENYIVVDGKSVKVFVQGAATEILMLDGGEAVVDIDSVGNTIVVTTGTRVLYILYLNNQYKFLGAGIPVPHIEFQTISNYGIKGTAKEYQMLRTEDTSAIYNPINLFDVSVWNKAIKDKEDGNSTAYTQRLQQIEDELWSDIKKEAKRIGDLDRFCAPFLVRYAVRLYDGSYINHSVPILLGSGFDRFLSVTGEKVETASLLHTYIGYTLENVFDVTAHMRNWSAEGWEDIIESVDIFASTPIYFPYLNSQFKELSLRQSSEGTVSTYTYEIPFKHNASDDLSAIENELISKGVFYKIGSFPLNDDRLIKGWKLKSAENLRTETDLVLTDDRLEDAPVNSDIVPGGLLNYNNRLLATDVSSFASRGYSFLNATNIAIGNNAPPVSKPYVIKYYIRGAKETEVLGKYYDGSDDFYAYIMDTSDEGGSADSEANVYGFITHPDPNCYKVRIWTQGGDVYEYGMKAHPRLNCSYAFWGLSNTIGGGDVAGNDVSLEEFIKEDRLKLNENKVYAYGINNPFLMNQTFTFQSRVIGVAVATTALSQGQFGQFPLYVFTEDGIWAMETAADGSFITSKPLSREVCTNPDSITSIDNAVVFVTKKAVMMISGSQVANISAYMNGRHYTPNESAQNVIRKQEGFSGFIPAVTDEDPFMQFMQDAKVAYDYAGQRLIFISPSNKDFQYVYKIDTQTWHKIAFEGFDLVQPLNSFPECLIRGVVERNFPEIYCTENSSSLDPYELLEKYGSYFGMDMTYLEQFLLYGERVPLYGVEENEIAALQASMQEDGIRTEVDLGTRETTCVYDLSTVLDASRTQDTAKGILITRPFDLGMPDVYKSITEIKIRGDYDKGNVKWLLQGSDNGRDFYTLTSLRGKSWKMFRIFILADLEPTERLSWIDIDFEPRYNNRLR